MNTVKYRAEILIGGVAVALLGSLGLTHLQDSNDSNRNEATLDRAEDTTSTTSADTNAIDEGNLALCISDISDIVFSNYSTQLDAELAVSGAENDQVLRDGLRSAIGEACLIASTDLVSSGVTVGINPANCSTFNARASAELTLNVLIDNEIVEHRVELLDASYGPASCVS